MKDIKDCTWGIIVFDPATENDEGVEIVHRAAYFGNPNEKAMDDLKKELAEDEEFGLTDIVDRLEFIPVDGDTFKESLVKY